MTYYRNTVVLFSCLLGFLNVGLAQAQDVLTVINNKVGIGITNPTETLHVVGSSTAQVLVENTNAADGADRVMFRLQDASMNKLRFAIEGQSHTWTFDNSGNNFQINKAGTGVNEFRFEDDGDSRQRGRSFATNHVNTSSREAKTDFAPVDEQLILEQLAAVPITTWRYKTEKAENRHLGPVAEDFQQVFGFGDGVHISTVDANGVALAALKALTQRASAYESEMAQLKANNAALNVELKHLKAENGRIVAQLKEREAQLAMRLEQVEQLVKTLVEVQPGPTPKAVVATVAH